MAKTHYLLDNFHYKVDNSIPPAVTIDSGDTVVFECREASDGQAHPNMTIEDMKNLDWDRVHALTGPVYVNGAEPGDVLEVEIRELQHHGWGYSGVWPGKGLLAEDFGDEYALQHWWVGEDGRVGFKPNIRIPVEPFIGFMGNAPAEAGAFNTMMPRPTGGNMDIRHLTVGSTLFLPVAVPGALFSAGDCHLGQGDGEVCLTAMEAPLTATLRFKLHKGRSIKEPQYITAGPTTSKFDGMGYYATTASGPDLYVNSQNAVRYMLDLLQDKYGLTRMEAYILSSVVGDLKICEIVDAPNWLVSFSVPRSIFIDG